MTTIIFLLAVLAVLMTVLAIFVHTPLWIPVLLTASAVAIQSRPS